MRVKTYTEAVRLANSAGLDAAKQRMRKAGRKVMSASDYDHAVRVTQRLLENLGFDIGGWIASAGVPRNDPEPQPARKSTKRRQKQAPVQLSFGFA